jgi:hypothetical protein
VTDDGGSGRSALRPSGFSSLLLYAPIITSLTGPAEPQMLSAQMVSSNYFSTLGVKPLIGRGFLPEEDASPGAIPVAVISYGMWTWQFGRDPQITSRNVRLNGRPFRIVGVAPPGFQGLFQMTAADLYVPMMMYPQIYVFPNLVNQRRALLFSAVGCSMLPRFPASGRPRSRRARRSGWLRRAPCYWKVRRAPAVEGDGPR